MAEVVRAEGGRQSGKVERELFGRGPADARPGHRMHRSARSVGMLTAGRIGCAAGGCARSAQWTIGRTWRRGTRSA